MTSARAATTAGPRGVVMVDVARVAGVSQKTVSRVVNGAPHVRPHVRERVKKAIEELGYRPNSAAQALARERSHTIGVLALGTRFFGPSRRVFTLEHEARRLGYTMALTSVPDLSARSVADGIDALLQRGVEGLVVEVPTHLINIDPAQLAGLPVVTSAGWITGVSRQAVVDIDQEEACRKLTTYLLDLGHETVWHVGGPRDWMRRRNASSVGDRLYATQVPACRACYTETGQLPRVTYRAASSPTVTMSPQSSPLTTKWRWGSFGRSTRPGGTSRAMFRSSGLTMFPRRSSRWCR